MTSQITRVVIYARFSSDHQREESITAQIRACEDYAQKQGYQVVKTYTDEARSATTDDRPSFLQMMDDLKTGRIIADLVLVHKLDRFARNRYDSAVYRKQLTDANVRLVAVDQPLDDSPESVLLESLLEGLAEYYSKNLAREVMKGMKENAYQAKYNGGWIPLGYSVTEDKDYIINEQEAPIIRLIFSMFLEGHGYTAIQKKLNEMGYKTRRNKPFGKNSIFEILRNPKYAGYYVFNRAPRRVNGKRNWHRQKSEEEIIKIPGAIPAIISEEEFQMVQQRLEKRKSGPRQRGENLYFLTGKVKCGNCGSSMVGNSTRNRAGTEPFRYYECNRRLRTRDCDSQKIRKEYLEQFVLNAINQDIFAPQPSQELARRIVDLSRAKSLESMEEQKNLHTQLQEVEGKINNIIRAIEDGAMDYSLLGDRLKELNARKQDLEYRLAVLRSPLDDITEEMVLDFLRATKKVMNQDGAIKTKNLVDLYIHEVVVTNGDIEVFLKISLGADNSGVGGGT